MLYQDYSICVLKDDLDGFVEHLEEYKTAGKIYAANVMDAGLVKNQSVFKEAYDMGSSI